MILESGIMHHADTPEQTLGLPDYAVTFLKEIPVAWDDTKYIAGYPGKDVVIARKRATGGTSQGSMAKMWRRISQSISLHWVIFPQK